MLNCEIILKHNFTKMDISEIFIKLFLSIAPSFSILNPFLTFVNTFVNYFRICHDFCYFLLTPVFSPDILISNLTKYMTISKYMISCYIVS